jgi:hypothetical protein
MCQSEVRPGQLLQIKENKELILITRKLKLKAVSTNSKVGE